MSYITRFASGNRATKQIINNVSTAGFPWSGVRSLIQGAKSVASGAMTANTLKTVISVSGSAGVMDYLTIKTVDATSRTLRVKITVDGVVVFDFTSAATATTGDIACIISSTTDTNASAPEPSELKLTWNNTLLIETASSVTETDKFTYYYRYNLEQ